MKFSVQARPSWVDPRSGEIINASVLMYNDVVKLAANWRFVQTAQVDERVRGKELPDDVFQESLEYILAHEVGHCLGLMHNMAASSAFPVDSLRSASFTQQHGTTPSIMDYARFNYVAQPGDKGVKLTPPDLGPYDDYVIKYAYTPLPDKKDMFDEEKTIRGWIDEKVGDPIYRYAQYRIGMVLAKTFPAMLRHIQAEKLDRLTLDQETVILIQFLAPKRINIGRAPE